MMQSALSMPAHHSPCRSPDSRFLVIRLLTYQQWPYWITTRITVARQYRDLTGLPLSQGWFILICFRNTLLGDASFRIGCGLLSLFVSFQCFRVGRFYATGKRQLRNC